MTAQSALSTLTVSKPNLPDWIAANVDYRRGVVDVKAQDGSFKLHRKFDMAAEFEVAVTPMAGLTLDASVGVYGDDHKQEFRRSFVQLQPVTWALARAGRFQQPFGINTPDHTWWPRQRLGLGQGSEAFAGEVAVMGEWGEVIASRVLGSAYDLESDTEDGYVAEDEEGQDLVYTRATAYLGESAQAGASLRLKRSKPDAVGLHGAWAPWHWFYALGEWAMYDMKTREYVAGAKLGVEPFRGVHGFVTYEMVHDGRKIGIGSQLLPAYGVDTTVRYARTYSESSPETDEFVAVLHLYL